VAAVAQGIGIDVGKAHLDIASRPSGEAWRVGNDEAAIVGLVGRPRRGAHAGRARGHRRAGGPVAAALAKTDRLDAHVLAHFAAAVRPEPRPLPDASSQALTALVVRRRQLLEMLVAERLGLAYGNGSCIFDPFGPVTTGEPSPVDWRPAR
jgi:transposase